MTNDQLAVSAPADQISARIPICHIVADGSPGGGTTAVLGLCEDLLRSGAFDVSLITQVGSHAAQQARMIGLAVSEMDFFVSRLDWRVPGKIRRFLADFRPQIVHCHGSRAGLPVSRLELESAFVYTVHGYHFLKKPVPFRQLARAAERRIAAAADHVVFVSNADAEIARRSRIAPRASSVIYNGIELPPWEDDARKQHALVFASRLHRQKNPLFLVEIMNALPSDVGLLLIGGGELDGEVRAAVRASGLSSRVEFAGALGRDQVLDAVRRSKLYLLPSLWEGLPIGPIEAMACGVPVVASDIPGTREVVTDGITGVLVREFDGRAYAKVIDSLLKDDDRRVEMGLAARADVSERFHRAAKSEEHRRLYVGLLTGGEGRS